MLRRLFLAPGSVLYRRLSKKRKKFRFVSKTHEKGPVLRLSLLFWLCASVVAFVCYAAVSGPGGGPSTGLPEAAVAPFPSALAAEARADVEPEPAPVADPPRPPTMAESAQMPSDAPDQAAGAPTAPAAGSREPGGPQAQASAAQGASPQAGGPGRLDGPPSTPATISVPRELVTPQGATGERLPEAWLVIVESIPKSKREEAEQARARQKRKGVDLSIMDTDAYPRLKSGLWALALGPYDSKREAEAAAAAIKPKVKDLMVRRGL
ncbi:MAG: SPOR domain-containing protein [Deltaproteobacteria bacterium]|jgi:hypothetical protein|nr:SPOR domain-containing protein [Deltaproteobacteria bacterium]